MPVAMTYRLRSILLLGRLAENTHEESTVWHARRLPWQIRPPEVAQPNT